MLTHSKQISSRCLGYLCALMLLLRGKYIAPQDSQSGLAMVDHVVPYTNQSVLSMTEHIVQVLFGRLAVKIEDSLRQLVSELFKMLTAVKPDVAAQRDHPLLSHMALTLRVLKELAALAPLAPNPQAIGVSCNDALQSRH